jgi:excisionase family DNA binding protein
MPAPNDPAVAQLSPPVPILTRLALSKAEAAAALGVSVDFFEEHVMHELRIVRRGRRRLIPVEELRRWLDESAARTLAP